MLAGPGDRKSHSLLRSRPAFCFSFTHNFCTLVYTLSKARHLRGNELQEVTGTILLRGRTQTKKRFKRPNCFKKDSVPEPFRRKGSAFPQGFLKAVPGREWLFIMKVLSHRKKLIITTLLKLENCHAILEQFHQDV